MKPSIFLDLYPEFVDNFEWPLQETFEEDYWLAVPELELQSRWFEGDFGTHFRTTQGLEVEVLDFGIWNHSAGPDFAHCAVRIDGVEHRGAMELDPFLQDWELHGHRDNAAYEEVKLHLHLWNARPQEEHFIRTASNRLVPQVKLDATSLLPLKWSTRSVEVRLGKCAEHLKRMSDLEIQNLLKSAAYHRLKEKEAVWLRRSKVLGHQQAAYQAIASALGYSRNATTFTILAQRLTLKELRSLKKGELESIVFGVAGFLEQVPYDASPPDTRRYLKQLWAEWWKFRQEYEKWLAPEQRVTWDLTGTRPANHPQRRLAALVVMLQQWKSHQATLFPEEEHEVSYEAILQKLRGLKHAYWEHHYTLSSKGKDHPMQLIGETRAHEIYLNAVLPAYISKRPALWEHYEALPAPDLNQQVRRAALRLFGDARPSMPWLKKAMYQQGLLKLYRDFCLSDYSACEKCALPGLLSS